MDQGLGKCQRSSHLGEAVPMPDREGKRAAELLPGEDNGISIEHPESIILRRGNVLQ